MSRPLALFDIDNTIYHGFSYVPLLHTQVAEGLVSESVFKRAARVIRRLQLGQLEYEPAITQLLDIYAAGLKGRSLDEIQASTRRFFEQSSDFYPFAKPLIELLNASHDVIIVTGEPQTVGQVVADVVGAAGHCSTEFELADDRFTGRVTSHLATRHEKHDAVKHLLQGHNSARSLAFGDSEGDVEMLRAAQHAVCINPTPGLRRLATRHDWHLVTPATIADAVDQILSAPK